LEAQVFKRDFARGVPVAGAAKLIASATLGILLSAIELRADESPRTSSPGSPSRWSGAYIGGHLGYAWGDADWTAYGPGAAVTTGGFDFGLAYNAFKGTGSYYGGLQAGYNYRLPSGIVIGFEADVTAPNTSTDTQTITSAAVGQASFTEKVEMSGTLRGRLGYMHGNWLLYGTAGYAWSYDHLTRSQLVGTPVGGTAIPGTVEKSKTWLNGWAAGAGVEVPVAANWTASLEYLFTAFGTHSAAFPAGAQRFETDPTLQSVRVGLNYQFTEEDLRKGTGPTPPGARDWSVHAQTTYVQQYAFPFRAPYIGPNSLISDQTRQTWDASFYVGWRLWRGAELWINPEIDQGFGLSGTVGVAGYVSGEAYKLGANYPYTRLPRTFIRQTIDLGGATEKVEAAANQLAGTQTANRLVFTVGKFSVVDVFDTNKYAHDARTDFLNWALLDTGTFDYAADAWGFTYGAAVEWYQGPWTFRGGLFDMSIVPNSTDLDPRFEQVQWVGEIERRYEVSGKPGKLAVTGFLTRGRMGAFADAIRQAQLTGLPADIAAVRQYRSRTGISVNLEQQLTSDLGFFVRAGLSNGTIEPYEFTDIDRTLAAGLVLQGKRWGRPNDTIGLGGVINGITGVHETFLNFGGLGILVGDGQLPNPGTERIIETYYSMALSPSSKLTFDYQFIDNPAYNQDRGPVSVIGTRLRASF
jgi:high affinity Mn2+ porin